MRIGIYAAMAGGALALLISAPAMAKSARPAHHAPVHSAKTHRAQPDRQYAKSHYNYRSASVVREAFTGVPHGMRSWRERHYGGYAYEERHDSRVVENLRGDFTGGVGYGADGFVDGYGQTHFYVGSFRGMNPLPHGPYLPNRAGPRAF